MRDPEKYTWIDQDERKAIRYRFEARPDRAFASVLLACAAFWGLVWWLLSGLPGL